ncbi:MAG: DHH family phosphoesterase [Anaerovoracaceae bacterium]|jgi:phosphoesterase RecJ-like protein
MKENNSLKEIGLELERAGTILLFTHQNVDGDAIGAASALCRVLRGLGKTCFILPDEELPEYLRFLDDGFCTQDESVVADPDVTMCVDCSEPGRFPTHVDKFYKGKVTICIDHHRTDEPFCQLNHIDPGAAATSELIFALIKEMGWELDRAESEAIFAGITTDTGNFQYSNTTKKTHQIVCELYDHGIDASRVSTNLYECVKPERFRVRAKILDTMEILADGRLAIACATQQMLKETGAVMSDTEGAVSDLRSIRGVAVAVMLKEGEDGKTFVSLRAKGDADVLGIAQKLGGGGHTKAAGCTLNKSLQESYEEVKRAALEYLA